MLKQKSRQNLDTLAFLWVLQSAGIKQLDQTPAHVGFELTLWSRV